MTTKSFKIITLGCKVNQYESAYLKESLLRAGLCEASRDESADIAVINTCIVTQRASYQSRQAIRKAVKENPSGVVAAIGCYAQVFPEELSQIPEVNLIAGNTVKSELPDILMGRMDAGQPCLLSEEFTPDKTFDRLPIKRFLGRARAFLKIQDGCQSYCSYCIVPFARGPLRSLDPPRVIVMLKALWKEGHREVVLTGVHLGKYGVDLNNGTELKDLLRVIGREGPSVRIRLSSIEPNEIDRDLIDMVTSEDWLCRHFHIPLQSGDDEILKKMNRNYTAQDFVSLIERIHNKIPFAAIGVDVMVGFPGEDDRAYENTFSLIKDLPVSYLHVFPFSLRKGTPAAGFSDQVDQKVIKERAAELRSLGQEKRDTFHRSCLGKDFSVLAEGWDSEEKKTMKGTSDNYLPVIFFSSQDCRSQLVPVRMVTLEKESVIGMVSARISTTARGVHG